jgi:putative DNA primase/helicase
VLVYDAFRDCVVTTRPPPWDDVDRPARLEAGEWTDVDTVRACSWLARKYGVDFSIGGIEAAVSVVAERTIVHPVRDWLDSLRWDGKPRLGGLFVDYFGAFDSPYARGVGARFAIGAVARIYQPGSKVDCTPVLEGPQGRGKSTGMQKLVGAQWYFDSPFTMGDKDGYQQLRGKWVGELGELHSLSRSDMNRAKTFLTATADTYRPSYARRAKDFKRQCVFCGNTNNTAPWLRDETGNRRFWPIRCGTIDLAAIERDRGQLWAEARARYESGERWHVDTEEFRTLCELEQEARFAIDPWEPGVYAWLMNPIAPQRRAEGVTMGEVLGGALDLKTEKWGMAEQGRVAAILHRLGWERGEQRRESGERVRRWKPRAAQLVLNGAAHGVSGAVAGDGSGDTVNAQDDMGKSRMSPAS